MAARNDRKMAALAAALALAFGTAASAQSDVDPRPSTFPQTQARADTDGGELADLAHEHAELSTFAAALEAAGLERSLTDGKHYTVFAPTNEALEDKPGKDVETLLEPENRDELISFVRAHIVADAIDLQSPRQIAEAKTIDGETIEIDRDEGVVEVEDARVVNPNGISIGNLKLYAIDDVLARSGKPVSKEQARNRDSSALAPGRTPGVASER